ncbi:MAG: glycosyltransferase family 2 protein [Anaerolineaceae bacterium]|nr:glycosyltransferase family 2 protein [Anaerolineaceae bacterium]
MSQKVHLSLIIPVYNEEKRLPDSISKIRAFVDTVPYSVEVLFVANGCTDKSYEMVSEYQDQYPYVQAVYEKSAGKGNAVKRGMMKACGSYRMFADVDFAMPITEVSKFIPPELPDCQVAIASRTAAGSVRKDEPLIRRLSSRVFNFVVDMILHLGIRDTQCGFKCFSAEAAEKIFSLQRINGWAFDAEILFIAKKLGYRITEIPVVIQYEENSKIKLWSAVPKMLMEILQVRKNDRSGMYQ